MTTRGIVGDGDGDYLRLVELTRREGKAGGGEDGPAPEPVRSPDVVGDGAGGGEDCGDGRALPACRRLVAAAIVLTALHLSTVGYVCGAGYFWRGGWADEACAALPWTSWDRGDHPGFPMWPAAVPLAALLCGMPALLSAFPSLTPRPGVYHGGTTTRRVDRAPMLGRLRRWV